MSNILHALGDVLNKQFADNAKSNTTVSRDTVEDMLRQSLDMLQCMEKSLATGSDKEVSDVFANKIKPGLNELDSKYKNIYTKYQGFLKGSAASAERTRPLKGLLLLNQNAIKTVNTILGKFTTIFPDKEIDVYGLRLSNLSVMGAIKMFDIIIDYTRFMYTLMFRLSVDPANVKMLPKYRLEFLVNNTEYVAKLVNDAVNGNGIVKISDDIEKMKRTGNDAVVGFGGTFNFYNMIQANAISDPIIDALGNVLNSLNIFRHIQEWIDDYRIEKNNRNKEIKEWMENHVAILRLELNNLDPSDPEYVKLMNVIKAYDVEITKYDRDIKDFEEG
jgi:flavodoxin